MITPKRPFLLAALAAHGLISRVETVESQGRFEAPTTRHHQLICGECKEIVTPSGKASTRPRCRHG